MVKIARKDKTEKTDRYYSMLERKKLESAFIRECSVLCTNEDELCDIVLDLCYQIESLKQFAWELCGDVILRNLLRRNNAMVSYPRLVDRDGEFTYCGREFVMTRLAVKDANDDYTE